MKIQTLVYAVVSIIIGTFASAISSALWWYLMSFLNKPDDHNSPLSGTLSNLHGLALVLGLCAGAALGFLVTIITTATRAHWQTSALIGAGIGFVFFFLLLNAGGTSKADFSMMISPIFTGALTGFTTSLLFKRLNNQNSLT